MTEGGQVLLREYDRGWPSASTGGKPPNNWVIMFMFDDSVLVIPYYVPGCPGSVRQGALARCQGAADLLTADGTPLMLTPCTDVSGGLDSHRKEQTAHGVQSLSLTT
eukprot:2776221-Pyramimonas_sp.AAC.1